MGRPIKIIDVKESGDHFVLREKELQGILEAVPEHMPVAVVGVVGAFRTGKSFLLDFFLRYLKNADPDVLDNNFSREDTTLKWMEKGGKLEGGEYSKHEGFKWKSGDDRCTTGIWMWNEYFVRKDPKTQKPIAVFLVDTQGMYDHETGQHLTASIFGLGALLSSYTVFNLMFQIQEDNLQHLALFSEYGRVAVTEAGKMGKNPDFHAFQKLEFLVRDFPHFKKGKGRDLEDLQQEMATYLEKVMSSKYQQDLKEVRDQVELCYEEIMCYCLPHPGHEVSEEDEDFDGDVKKIRPKFRRLLGDYIRRVFNDRIAPKRVMGEQVNAMQLFELVKVYCKLFQETEIFPAAMTLFRATQEANMAYATNKALKVYKTEMDKIAGPGASYKQEDELNDAHKRAVRLALLEYSENTKLGTEAINKSGEKNLKMEIQERFADYSEANRLRDPISFFAPYIIPIMIGVTAYIIRYVLESICSRRMHTCLDIADFFGSLYTVIFSFLLFHLVSTLYGVRGHMKGMFSLGAAATKIKSD